MPWGSYSYRPRRIVRVTKLVPDIAARYYTTGQIARVMSVSCTTVRNWARAGLFGPDGVTQPSGRLLVSKAAFERFLKGQPKRLGRSRALDPQGPA